MNFFPETYISNRYEVPRTHAFPCVFPVFSLSLQIFPVLIHVICDYYIHKTDLADLSSLKKNWEFSRQTSKYLSPLESGNLQLEQTKFPVFPLCFRKIS